MPEHHTSSTKKSPIHNPTVLLVAGFLLLLLGFVSGAQYQKTHLSNTAKKTNQTQGEQFGQRGRGGFNGLRPTLGTVTAVSSTSITVKDQSGSSKTLTIADSTTVTNNSATVSKSDIKVGDTVAVITDTTNTNQAQRIMLNPSFGGGNGPPSSSDGENSPMPMSTN